MENIIQYMNHSYTITFFVFSVCLTGIISIFFARKGIFRLFLSSLVLVVIVVNTFNVFLLTGTDRPLKMETAIMMKEEKVFNLVAYFPKKSENKIYLFVVTEKGNIPLHLSIPYSEKSEKEIKKALKKQEQNKGKAKFKIEKHRKGEFDITPKMEFYNETYNRDVPLKDGFLAPDENFGF